MSAAEPAGSAPKAVAGGKQTFGPHLAYVPIALLLCGFSLYMVPAILSRGSAALFEDQTYRGMLLLMLLVFFSSAIGSLVLLYGSFVWLTVTPDSMTWSTPLRRRKIPWAEVDGCLWELDESDLQLWVRGSELYLQTSLLRRRTEARHLLGEHLPGRDGYPAQIVGRWLWRKVVLWVAPIWLLTGLAGLITWHPSVLLACAAFSVICVPAIAYALTFRVALDGPTLTVSSIFGGDELDLSEGFEVEEIRGESFVGLLITNLRGKKVKVVMTTVRYHLLKSALLSRPEYRQPKPPQS